MNSATQEIIWSSVPRSLKPKCFQLSLFAVEEQPPDCLESETRLLIYLSPDPQPLAYEPPARVMESDGDCACE